MGTIQSVALDCFKAWDGEECAMWFIFVFYFRKIEGGIIWVSSPVSWWMLTLDFPLKIWQDEGRTALPAFVLFYLLWRKQTVFIGFLFWDAVLSLLLHCAISRALHPLHSAALPVFWQLNLPHFLVIISSLRLTAKGACGQQFPRKSQYRMVPRMWPSVIPKASASISWSFLLTCHRRELCWILTFAAPCLPSWATS